MYIRKTKDVYILLGNYGYGWDELLTEESRKEALQRLKEYRENERNAIHKIKKVRIKKC